MEVNRILVWTAMLLVAASGATWAASENRIGTG